MQITTRSSHRCSNSYYLVVLLVLAATLVGCSGSLALKPIQAPCPNDNFYTLSWSPDGTQIAYHKLEWPSSTTLNILDLDSGSTTRLADVPSKPPRRLEWSPDGERLLSAYEVASYEYELVTFDLTGTKQVLPEHSPGVPHYRWSPDGEHIAVTYAGPGESDLFVYDHNGAILWRLSDLRPDLIWPSGVEWSPDGTRLAFGDSTRSPGTLVTVSPGGDAFQVHTAPGGRIVDIRWSPDGKSIAFNTFDTPNQYRLYVIEPGSTDAHLMANERTMNWRWLPDSSGIIFIAETQEVVTLARDGTRTVLSAIPQGSYYPDGYFPEAAFSPDATQLAYIIGGRYSAPDLYIMNVDGTNAQQITDNPGNHKCFQWPF